MGNIIKFERKDDDREYLIGQQSLDELAAISRQLTAAQSDPCRCCDHLEGIEYLGEILADVERHPVEGRPHIDAYGQLMLIGIFSDLCKIRDGKQDQESVDSIVKRLGKLLERYEP